MARIDRVIDHIHEELSGDLSLGTLARVAHFSPYHFHRIFKGVTGETLNAFVRRARIERAARLLRAAPQRLVSSVALEVGFSSLAALSRAFKEHYGISPGHWDRRSGLKARSIDCAYPDLPVYSPDELSEMASLFPVRIEHVPARRIAYVRTADSYSEGAFQRTYDALMAWVSATGVRAGDVFAMSHDQPDLTSTEKCRLDVACVVPDDLGSSDGVRTRLMPAMRVASASCTGAFENVHKVWEFLYRHWLPRSRYEPRNLPAMERFVTQPEDWWRDQAVNLEAWIPVRALRKV